MKTRLYTSEDYPTVSRWWTEHGARAVPKNLAVPEKVLPECGVVVETADTAEMLAAAWLYQDNSRGVAWVAWIVTRPGLVPLTAARVLRVLMGGVEAVARSQERALLFTMTKSFGLQQWLEREGWSPNDRGSVQYFKELQPEPSTPAGT